MSEELVSLEEQASMEDDRSFLLVQEYDGDQWAEMLGPGRLVARLRGNEEHLYYSGDGADVVYVGLWLGRGDFREMRLVLADADVSPDLDDFFCRRYELEFADPWSIVYRDGTVCGRFVTREKAEKVRDGQYNGRYRVAGPDRPGLGFTLRIDGRA